MKRIGIDTGGTFTDTVLTDGRTIRTVKTPTTSDLISGVLEGFDRVCDESDLPPDAIDFFCHGHTVATNAIIEDEGAKTALITTKGFRDTLEVAEAYRDASLLYNPCGEYEPPVVPRKNRFEVTERVNADGEVEMPLDMDEVDEVIDRLNERDIQSVAVCLLHSYQNSGHEHEVARRLAERLEDIEFSISADVSPEIREYSRTATTVVDGYVKPTISAYLSTLETSLDDWGLQAPINIMKSDGGMARPHIVSERPVSQVISGPVAATKAAQYIGESIHQRNVITVDMGGTSTDTAMITDGSLVEDTHREIRGMKINGPFININTIGAGGGSIASVTASNALRVGPQSAGADPGPVCYGRGGERPTVTDADLVLGILNPENFAGGEFTLDENAAREAIRADVAEPLDMGIEEAAAAIRRVTDNKIASAIRVVSVKKGHDPRDFVLMGFGGAGPMHACNVAKELDIETVVFPNNPGLTSALGLLLTDVEHNYVRSVVETVDELDLNAVSETVRELVAKGNRELASEDIPPEDRGFTITFDMMYSGQAHHLNIPLRQTDAAAEDFRFTWELLEDLVDRFEREHEAKFGFVDEHHPCEIVNVRVVSTGEIEELDLESLVTTVGTTLEDAKRGEREIFTADGEYLTTPFYDWAKLDPGHEFDGPAVVEVENSTIWIPPDVHGRIDRYKNAIIELE